MALPPIKIRVGASLDANAAAVFRPLVDASKAARAQIEKDTKATGKTIESVYRSAPEEAKKGFDGMASAGEDATKRIVEGQRSVGDEAERSAAKTQKAWERASKAIASESARNMRAIMNAGVGVASGFARGAGVNFNLEGIVKKNVELASQAVAISNSGYMEGAAGPNGQRQNAADIRADVLHASKSAGIDQAEVSGGLGRFVAKSSDLATGRSSLEFMAKFAKATSSDMGDVADAMGEVVNKLGDVPNKAQALEQIMMLLAKQGKLGAVEMKDQANSLAVMVGSANRFAEGSKAAMGELGAAFQITKKYGGVKGPAQAATAVSNFATDLSSPAGLKHLAIAGINPFADKGKTKLRSVEDIIIEALQKSGGDLSKLGGMFRSKRSGAVMTAFDDTYSKAEATKKGSGADAVHDMFKQYGAPMSAEEFTGSLSKAMNTTATEATLFNTKLEEMGEAAAGKVLPALEKLEPTILSAVGALGNVVSWAADNPGKAIAAAIVVSIEKAAIDTALKTGLEKMFMSGGMAIGTASLVVMGALTILSGVVEAKRFAGRQEGEQEVNETQRHLSNVNKAISEGRKAPEEDVAGLKSDAEIIRKRMDEADKHKNDSLVTRGTDVVLGRRTEAELGKTDADKVQFAELSYLLKDIRQALQGTLKTAEQNAPSGNVPYRTGPGAAPIPPMLRRP